MDAQQALCVSFVKKEHKQVIHIETDYHRVAEQGVSVNF